MCSNSAVWVSACETERNIGVVCVCVCLSPRTFCSVISFSCGMFSIPPFLPPFLPPSIHPCNRLQGWFWKSGGSGHTRTGARIQPYECNQVCSSTCQESGKAGTIVREHWGVCIICVYACAHTCVFFCHPSIGQKWWQAIWFSGLIVTKPAWFHQPGNLSERVWVCVCYLLTHGVDKPVGSGWPWFLSDLSLYVWVHI